MRLKLLPPNDVAGWAKCVQLKRLDTVHEVQPLRIVTVVPCDHFEWQPPHMSALNGSRSGPLMENMRDPESSDGMN